MTTLNINTLCYSFTRHHINEDLSPTSPTTIYSPTEELLSRAEPICYFSYIPSAPSDHWSLETPVPSPDLRAEVHSDPYNPLLAARIPLLTPAEAAPQRMGAEKLMQLQTASAHQQRPRPQPHQDVLELSDDSVSSRASSESSSSSSSSLSSRSRTPKVCSRCQTTFGDFVAYSLNGYYCKRCAKITGYGAG